MSFRRFSNAVFIFADSIRRQALLIGTSLVQYKGSTLAACSVALALRTKKFSVHKPVKWTAQLEEEWKNDPDPRFSGAHVKKEDIEGGCVQTSLCSPVRQVPEEK